VDRQLGFQLDDPLAGRDPARPPQLLPGTALSVR
jgi:hypothetical protein